MYQSRSTHKTSTNRTTALLAGIALGSALVAGGVSAAEMNFETAPAMAAEAQTAPAA